MLGGDKTVKDQILKPMSLVRDYCNLIKSLRVEHDIPVSYPLYEVQINSLTDEYVLLKEERQLICDECNVDWCEPFIADWDNKPYDTWVEKEKDGKIVRLNITKDHHLERRYQERKKHREKMQARKEKGIWVK